MKKCLFVALTVIAAGCTKPEKTVDPDPVAITVKLPEGVKPAWKTGDRISVVSFEKNAIATSDVFEAAESGETASFSGIYTGADDSQIVVVYPALEAGTGGQFESEPVDGNSAGYYRAVKTYNYMTALPNRDMVFRQDADGSTGNLEKYMLMTGKTTAATLKEEALTLSPKLAVVKLVLGASRVPDTEKLTSVKLTLSEGKPFTAYRPSLPLLSQDEQWTSTNTSESFSMQLGSFSRTDTLVTVYVPVFQSKSAPSLSGNSERTLTVELSGSQGVVYTMKTLIPAGSQAYKLTAGQQLQISGSLSDGEAPPEPPEPDYVLGTMNKVLDSSSGPLALEGNVLYAGASNQINIFDVSKPMSPVNKGQVTIKGSTRQMCVYDGKLFVTARETGVWIFDISNPYAPALLSRYDGIELSTGLDVAGKCMFVGQRQTGVEFVDISDPTRPQHIRAIKTSESQSVFYADGYLYSGEWSGGEVTVFNAANMGNIEKLKTVKLWGYGDGVWVTGDRLYASTGHNPKNDSPRTGEGNGHGVEIWDVSDRANPVRISTVAFDTFYKSGSDWWLNRPSGDGKTLFCGDVYNGIYVVDISDEQHPEIIASWCDTSAEKGKNHAVNSIAVGNGVLYMSCGGLYAIDCPRAKPTPRNRGVLPTGVSARFNYTLPSDTHFKAWKPSLSGAVRDAAVSPDGTALFVGCGQAGLAVVKQDGSGNLVTVKEYPLPFAGGVSVLGNRLYVSEAEKGVGVYKIGSNLALTNETYILDKLGKSAKYCYSYWLTTPNDKYLVSANRYSGWQFIAITGSSAAPTYTYRNTISSNVNYNKYVSENVCTDSNGNEYLPYATRNGLYWINLSSTDAAVLGTCIDTEKNALTEGVTEFKDGKALLTQSSRFKIIDANGTASTQCGSSTIKSGIPRWDGGDKVLICNYTGMRVSMYNLSNINSPEELFVEDYSADSVGGYPEPGLFWNGKAVVPCGYQGLLVEK